MRNYAHEISVTRKAVKDIIGEDPVDHVIRPGGGESPKYVFKLPGRSAYNARGGPEALSYLNGLLAGLTLQRPAEGG